MTNQKRQGVAGMFLNKEIVESKRNAYPNGTRVALVSMHAFGAPKKGTAGTVDYVDDMGNVIVNWDDGKHMAVLDGIDRLCRI